MFSQRSIMDECTTSESNRLTRLPMYYGLSQDDRNVVADVVHGFFA